jgi:hypothetical protein
VSAFAERLGPDNREILSPELVSGTPIFLPPERLMANGISLELRALIDGFSGPAEEIVNEFARGLEAVPTPSVIYHYTDGAGLRGILESGKLWFTDIFNLNDPTALRYGFQPAIELLQARAREGPPEMEQFAKNTIAMLRGEIEQIAHFFVCCFSKSPDDLGQWRAYADNGRGFAIGFGAPMLERMFCRLGDDPVPGHMTFPVTYDDDQLREMYGRIIAMVAPLVSAPRGRDLSADEINDYMSDVMLSLCVPIIRAALFFKHKAYENEQEYRFFQLHRAGPVPDLKFRGRPYSLAGC